MTNLSKFDDFQYRYRTEKIYTRKDLHDALEQLGKEMTVNRVVQSNNGRYGPDCCIALQILAVHKTPEGTLVIVK